MSERCDDVEGLLTGFSYDYEIIHKLKKLISNEKLSEYNSILLLYNFQYEKVYINKRMDYIGCVDVNIN
ncbi:MAG: hypothetical protein HDT39_06230 [Lachnospiraceae bacterium]|nr:hypothetical protein [Lachnospiraceae bacterium]